jgi:hypothetical protein
VKLHLYEDMRHPNSGEEKVRTPLRGMGFSKLTHPRKRPLSRPGIKTSRYQIRPSLLIRTAGGMGPLLRAQSALYQTVLFLRLCHLPDYSRCVPSRLRKTSCHLCEMWLLSRHHRRFGFQATIQSTGNWARRQMPWIGTC